MSSTTTVLEERAKPEQPEIVSPAKSQKQSVSDTSDKPDKQTDSITPKHPTDSHPTPQLTYSQIAIAERRLGAAHCPQCGQWAAPNRLS